MFTKLSMLGAIPGAVLAMTLPQAGTAAPVPAHPHVAAIKEHSEASKAHETERQHHGAEARAEAAEREEASHRSDAKPGANPAAGPKEQDHD